MDSSEFLTLAGRLVSMDKAGARSAVSRAYYSVFHLAQNVLSEIAGEASGRSHMLIPQYLNSSAHVHAIQAAGRGSWIVAVGLRRGLGG